MVEVKLSDVQINFIISLLDLKLKSDGIASLDSVNSVYYTIVDAVAQANKQRQQEQQQTKENGNV